MCSRQVKLQEFLTDSQVEVNTCNKDVSCKLEKAGAPKLTAVIAELETATYERYYLCNRKRMLRFCLEYLDSEGNVVMWGDLRRMCRQNHSGERGSMKATHKSIRVTQLLFRVLAL